MHQRTDIERATLLGRHILESIVASSSEAVVLLDAQNPELPVVYANSACETVTGACVDELIGRPWPLLEGNGGGDPGLERLRAAARCGEACDVSVGAPRRAGSLWSGEVSLRPLHAVGGEVEYLLCRYRASAGSERSSSASVEVGLLNRALGQARHRIASLEKTDPVTGLLRYEHFLALQAQDLATARREHHASSVLAFEVVELDIYGRTFGDKAAESALRMIAAQVAGAFRRASDSCARYDESFFVASVVGQAPDEARHLAERVAAKVRGLGLHNPRARSGRQLWVRHAVVGPEAVTEDARAVVERAVDELRMQSAPRDLAVTTA